MYTIPGGPECMHCQHPSSVRAGQIARLKAQIGRLEEGRRLGGDAAPVTSGCGPLDRLLPWGGLRRGTLVEWLAQGEGAGAATLAMLAAREAARKGGAVVVLDAQDEFYPPAAVRLGIEPDQLLVVQAANPADHAWALDQVLRSPGVAATVAWPEQLGSRLDGHAFRRLQLAVEQGGGLGLLLRPETARAEPSWADVRLLITPRPCAGTDPVRRLTIELLRCRAATGGRSVDVEWDDETCTVRLAPPVAHPAPYGCAAGA